MAALAAVMLAGVCCHAATRRDTSMEKARYYYLEGVRLQAGGDNAAAYECYKKAYSLRPDYTEAASAYGNLRLSVLTDTLQSTPELLNSLALMRPFVKEYSGDFFESQYFAYLAAHLDTLKEAIAVYERSDSLFPTKTATLVQLAEAYMADNNLPRAIDALNRYEKTEGMSPALSLRKISYFISAKDTAGALEETERLVDFSPREPNYRILQGNVFNALAMPDSALQSFLTAERMAPENGAAKLALADWYKEHGDSAAYDTKTYEALLSEDFDVQQKTELLAVYLQKVINEKGSTARGDHLFEALSRQYPHEPDMLDLGARYNAAKGNIGEAIEQISYAIDLSPDNENYWGQLMSYQLGDDKGREAMQTYERAKEHVTPSQGLKLIYANAASMASDEKEAVKAFDELLRDENQSLSATDSVTDRSLPHRMDYEQLIRVSTLYNMLGDMYYRVKKIPDAFRAYENALLFFPENAMVLNNYAYFLIENGGDMERAAEMSKRAVDNQPDNPTFIDTYAWILFKKGDYEDALTYQRSAVEKSEAEGDTSAELYDHYGDILFKNGKTDEAVENWKKALEQDDAPENADAVKRKIKERGITD